MGGYWYKKLNVSKYKKTPLLFIHRNRASVKNILLVLKPILLPGGDRGDLDHSRSSTVIITPRKDVGTGAALVSRLLIRRDGTGVPLRHGRRERLCGGVFDFDRDKLPNPARFGFAIFHQLDLV